MKPRALFLFGMIGLAISAPLLISPEENGSAPGSPLPFQAWTAGSSAAGTPNGPAFSSGSALPNSPFQFANSSSRIPDAGNLSSAWSEPVYFAFGHPSEFLRFDVTPDWIQTRWPRVSTFPAEDQLTGWRVPLVSGPRTQDIHGSLTWFFDNAQRVQRIGFRGWTGDASELVAFLQQQGFTRQNSNGAGLFSKSSWGRNLGTLRLDHPPVKQRDLPNEQLMILFEWVNPASSLKVSQHTQSILDSLAPNQW